MNIVLEAVSFLRNAVVETAQCGSSLWLRLEDGSEYDFTFESNARAGDLRSFVEQKVGNFERFDMGIEFFIVGSIPGAVIWDWKIV